MISEAEIQQIMRRVQVTDGYIASVVQEGILKGTILTGAGAATSSPTGGTAQFAGGTNFCPNSDFSFSYLAATVPGTDPGDAAADNQRLYRCYRQAVGANISATGVRTDAAESVTYAPIWDKPLGVIEMGAANPAENYDIAIQLTNNWLVPAQTWYVRIAIATVDSAPLPDGSRLFVGFWQRNIDTSENYIAASPISITATKFYVSASTSIEYKVIAKTDSGVSLESNVLTITDAPASFDAAHYVRINYPAASGFIEFFVYKMQAGVTTLIFHERNSSSLFAYDIGQTIEVVAGGFPSGDLSAPTAYTEVDINAVTIDTAKIFHNLNIRVPNYDTTLLVSQGTFLRIGVKTATTVNHQILIDTVWAGTSFNVWSPSPFDTYASLPSASITTGVPSAGNTDPDPPPSGGGTTCVASWHDLLIDRDAMRWEIIGECTPGMLIDAGNDRPNRIKKFIDGLSSQHYRISFSHGLALLCTPSHRFIRSMNDGSGIEADALSIGDTILGGNESGQFPVAVIAKSLVNSRIPVRAVKVNPGNNLFYAVGNRIRNTYVYCHNRKQDIDSDIQF